jgi:N-acetylmuramoyl-L-alanine amidase
MNKPRTVVIQLGHVGRETGATGAPGEKEYILEVSPFIENALKSLGYQVTVVHASFGKVTCDAFLALHCDGSNDPNAGGFSVGYPEGGNMEFALQLAAAYRFQVPFKFRGFNITKNMSQYYGYKLVNSPAKALLEMGFITNPQEAAWLRSHKKAVAAAVRDGFNRYFLSLENKL